MPVLEEPTVAFDEAKAFDKDFVKEMKKIESPPEPPLYHGRPGVHATPVDKRSPYWQPVDDQS
jgi:hypothetical protein